MYKILIAIGLCFVFSFKSPAQTVFENYRDGLIYFKVKDNSNVVIPTLKTGQKVSGTLYERYSGLSLMISEYGITEIARPFKTKHPVMERTYRVKFSNIQKIEKLIAELQELDYIEYAEKVQIYKLFFVPDDVHANQWYFNLIQAFDAWDISPGSNLVKVAVVDNAFRISHPDLAPAVYVNPNEIAGNGIDDDNNGFIDDVNGWDVADDDNDPEPPSNIATQFGLFDHGSHCAGIASAATNNSTGIAAIGNGVKIIPVKGTSSNNIIPIAIDDGAGGIDYAIAAGADVISLSWGGTTQDQTVTNFVNVALAQGIVVVAAAGNSGDQQMNYPAANPGVISVGAITYNDVMASFSNHGTWVDVIAPGDSIWSCVATSSDYGYQSGTSMACPMVAGLCGLMLSYDTSYTAAQIESCLKAGCENIDMENPSFVGWMGSGRINALRSLTCMNPSLGPIASYHTSSVAGVCEGETMSFFDQSIHGDSLFWSFQGGTPAVDSSATPSVTYAAAGTYSVTLIARNSSGSDTLTGSITVYPAPAASFTMSSDTVYIVQGGQLSVSSTSSNATAYSWDFGDSGTASGATATHDYTTAGTYTVTLLASNPGCSDTATMIVYVSSEGVGIYENLLEATLEIYPNPAYDQLTIDLKGNHADKVIICSSIGQEVMNMAVSNSGKMNIDLSNIAKGVYYVKVYSGRDVAVKKLTVLK